jgi:nuclear pore complex protein Nup93
LLAGSGVNYEDVASDLQSIVFHQNLETNVFLSNAYDIDHYLRIKKEENILTSIEESVRATAQEFDSYLAQNISLDWRQRKHQICQHFGLVSKQVASQQDSVNASNAAVVPKTWGKVSTGRLILGPLNSEGDFSDVDASEARLSRKLTQDAALTALSRNRAFAEIIQKLNKSRENAENVSLTREFGEVTQKYGRDLRSKQLFDTWRALSKMIGEGPKVRIQERKYAETHIWGKNELARAGLRKQMACGAREFLENQFFELLENELAKYPNAAKTGGVPSVANKVRGYLNVRYQDNAGNWTKPNLEINNNIPTWGVIFYLLRCGFYDEAVNFAYAVQGTFHQAERSFPNYLKTWLSSEGRQLPPDLQERIQTEFNQHVRFFGDTDPFKYALYKIVGRCDVSRKSFPEIISTTEDWLWVHLMLVREEDIAMVPIHERYSLSDLQRVVIQFGVKHFNPNKTNPVLYFQVLMLCGLFEYAIQYLYSFSPVDAVHFAIALTYYGLLRPVSNISSASDQLLVLDEDDVTFLDFVRLIGYYTRDFRRGDPVIAVEYLVLLSLNSDLPNGLGAQHETYCREALKELALETREFSTLLGDVNADGGRKPGAIEAKMKLINLRNEEEFLHAITEQAAVKAEEDGRTPDAILLYQLAEEYDTVLSLVNKLVGDTLAVLRLDEPISKLPSGASLMLTASVDPAQLARNLLKVYEGNPAILRKVSQRNLETCRALLHIVSARDAFAKNKWEDSLREVEASGIIALSPQADVGQVRQLAQQFVGLHESLARAVPSMLVMAMQCCVNVSQALQASHYSNAGRSSILADLRLRVRNCMVYAGMIQYRMPREVYAQLTNLEIMV